MGAGAILAGSREEVASGLIEHTWDPIAQSIEAEISRLRHCYSDLSGCPQVDPVAALAEVLGTDSVKMGEFICRNSEAKGIMYHSDAFVVRDLFDHSTTVVDETHNMVDVPGKGTVTFLPLTGWKQPGDAPLRFAIAHVRGRDRNNSRYTVRFPVIMIDDEMMDKIQSQSAGVKALEHFHNITRINSHDYMHSLFFYYGKMDLSTPESLKDWNTNLWSGKSLWKYSDLYNQNYELLSAIGHRKVMEKLFTKSPEFKQYIVKEAQEFSASLDELKAGLGTQDAAMAARIEHYLSSNYARFLFHIVNPDDPAFAFLHEKYPAIRNDLNITNGKGLVALLHAHDGIPGGNSGDNDIPFETWLRDYMAGMDKAIDTGYGRKSPKSGGVQNITPYSGGR